MKTKDKIIIVVLVALCVAFTVGYMLKTNYKKSNPEIQDLSQNAVVAPDGYTEHKHNIFVKKTGDTVDYIVPVWFKDGTYGWQRVNENGAAIE